MNQTTKNVPRWILAFIGSLLLFATITLICIRMTLFNQEFMINQVHKTDYVETIRKDMTESIQDLGRGSNIPPEVLVDVVPEKTVSMNVDNYIRSIYQEVPFKIQGEDQIKDNILKNVSQYAQQKNITIDETTQSNLNNLANSATKNYSNYIEIPYLLSYGKKSNGFPIGFDDDLDNCRGSFRSGLRWFAADGQNEASEGSLEQCDFLRSGLNVSRFTSDYLL